MTGATNWWTAFTQGENCPGAKKLEDLEVITAVKRVVKGMTYLSLGAAVALTAVAVAVPYLHLL